VRAATIAAIAVIAVIAANALPAVVSAAATPGTAAAAPPAAQQGGSAAPTPAPPHAYLYIGWPNDGQVVSSGKPVRVWFGLRNMGVAPKGVAFPNTGHHHLLIDADPPAPGEEIPNDRNHLHFGAGETETTVELAPGRHTLQLVMGDARHRSFDPPVVSKKITITVK
jgi:hypothetical protein